jgi:hypothetical protein
MNPFSIVVGFNMDFSAALAPQEPVFQPLDRKRSKGKNYYVYMTADAKYTSD